MVATDKKDVQPPKITKVEPQATSATLYPGDHFKVSVYVEDDSEILTGRSNSSVFLSLNTENGSSSKAENAYLVATDVAGKYEADFLVSDEWFAGEYYVSVVYVTDVYDNMASERYYLNSTSNRIIPDVTIRVEDKNSGPSTHDNEPGAL